MVIIIYYIEFINCKISNLKLKVNKKSNIYRGSVGFNFIGYKYQIINNKLNISYNRKTYYRIRKNLEYKKNDDYISYKKSLASYYGYFKKIKIEVKEDFKVKLIDIYNSYKKNNQDSLIIIKNGYFYNMYNNDAIIIWYLFDYIIKDNIVSFGNNSYDKVINRLKKCNISFIVVKDNSIILLYQDNNNTFKIYEKLANIAYDKRKQEEMLIKKLKLLIKKMIV